jgi:hypothetical protein
MVSGVGIYGDQAAGQIYVPRAKEMLRLLKLRAQLGGISTLSTMQQLAPDGTYCYAVVAGGVERAVIVPGTSSPATPAEELPEGTTVIPDFYSGVVQDGYLTEVSAAVGSEPEIDNLTQFRPTTECAKEEGLVGGQQSTNHLGVVPNPDPSYPISEPVVYDVGSTEFNSQYANIKPTLFSGRMRKLVQALMGFGIPLRKAGQPTSKLPKTTKQPKLPSQFALDLAAYGLQIKYDWHFTKTHGIGVATDGKLWLVELSQASGMLIMPLPVSRLSSDYVTTLRSGFKDAATLATTYGGFPTGEPMPSDPAPWIRAGRVVQVLANLSGFYGTAVAPTVGWAFNYAGTAAHNVAAYTDTWTHLTVDPGDQAIPTPGDPTIAPRGSTADTRLLRHGKVEWTIDASTPVALNADPAMVAAFDAQRGSHSPDVIDAAIWKLGRLSAGQRADLTSTISGADIDAGIAYVDALVMTPVVTATAAYTTVGFGPVLSPTSVPGDASSPVLQPFLLAPKANNRSPNSLWPADFRQPAFGPYKDDSISVGFFGEFDTKVFVYFDTTDTLQWAAQRSRVLVTEQWTVPPPTAQPYYDTITFVDFYGSKFDNTDSYNVLVAHLLVPPAAYVNGAYYPISPASFAASGQPDLLPLPILSAVNSHGDTVYGWVHPTSLAEGIILPWFDREAYAYAGSVREVILDVDLTTVLDSRLTQTLQVFGNLAEAVSGADRLDLYTYIEHPITDAEPERLRPVLEHGFFFPSSNEVNAFF